MSQRPAVAPALRPLCRALLVCGLVAGSGAAALAQESAAANAAAMPAATALATFDTVWTQVDQSDYRVGGSGLDWNQVREQYRPRAGQARTPAALRQVLQEMLDLIGESHFVVIPEAAMVPGPAAGAAAGDAGGASGVGRFGTGLTARLVGTRMLVTGVDANSAAASEGIAPGWHLASLDGKALAPVLAEITGLASAQARQRAQIVLQSEVQARLESRADASPVPMVLVDGAGDSRALDLVPQPRAGETVQVPMLPPAWLQVDAAPRALPGGGCAGVVRFNLWVPAVADQLEKAFPQLQDCRGMILDLRGNPGGVMAVMMRMAGHFVAEPTTLGTLTTGGTALNFRALPRRVTADGTLVRPYAGPVAVLVDQLSMSTSEMFASGMQAVGRVRVFGSPSPGMALPARTVTLPSGDVLMYAFAQYSDPLQRRIEGVGVVPDVVAAPDRDTLLSGRDVALDAALHWITTGADDGTAFATPPVHNEEQH